MINARRNSWCFSHQFDTFFGHAVKTAQVAPIRQRNPQIRMRPTEIIDYFGGSFNHVVFLLSP